MKKIIKIGGKGRAVQFNYRAIFTYEKVTGESYLGIIEQIAGGAPKLTAVVGMVYAGLVGADEKFSESLDTVTEWTMTMEQDDLTALFSFFLESQPQRKTDDAAPAQEGEASTGE